MSRINCYGDEENYGEVLPGVFLVHLVNMVAVDPEGEYEEGCWGLTFCNDPAFVFYEDPLLEGTEQHYQEQLIGQVYDCYRLWNVCLESGYNPEVDGYCLGYWLREQIAKYLHDNPNPVVVYKHRLNP
jgi:hypothetical protein